MKYSWKLASIICAAGLIFTTALIAQKGVTAILPNGREIHPAGNWISLAPYPFALSVRPDGREIAIPSIGFPFSECNFRSIQHNSHSSADAGGHPAYARSKAQS